MVQPILQYGSGFLLFTVLLGIMFQGHANAEYKLKDLKEPLNIQLQTPIDGTSAKEGDLFRGALTETYTYRGQSLPAGTQFQGTLVRVKPSHHLAQPGYVVLDVRETVFPNGETYVLDKYENRSKPLRHRDANNMKRVVNTSLPFVLINSATTVPLNLATNIPGWPVGVAAKMTLGVAREYYRKDKDPDRPDGHKIGYGMLVGTSLPGMMFIAAKRPEPQLKVGDNVEIFLDPEGLQELFDYDHRTSHAK